VGATDAFLEPVTIGATAPDPIAISLTRGNGRVRGQLLNAQDQPVANAQVVLIPAKLRGRIDLYKTATTDATGVFDFSGILPGEYRAFAWRSIQPFRYFDKDFLKAFEDRGESVVAEDGASRNITVRQIP
jgi:hypothetical protein